MERILSAQEMRLADEFTINNLGVSEDVLVERAGRAVAEEIINRFHGGRVLVCVGKGNNGADGKVIAQILSKTHGFSVATLNVSNGIFKLFDKKYDIIVDCIFGTGLSRIVDGKYKLAIEKINQSGCYVVACDIASGLSGNNGQILGVAVKANLTVAIQELKLGHFLNYGPDYSGEVIAKDIGISIWGEDYVKRFNGKSVKQFFPKRAKNTNKGCYGKACIIGGSKKFSGSILLSANALCALKMGVGYVNMVVPKSMFSDYLGKVPECILTPMGDNDGFFVCDKETLSSLLKYDCIAFGMGVGVNAETYKIVSYLLENYTGNLVIDADGLNAIAKFGVQVLENKKCKVILTPHIREFSRLTTLSVEEILADPISVAKEFAKKYNVVLLLKNSTSVITDGQEVFINTTGTPAMAKAGSGDVLSGLIAGILSRTDEVLYGVVAGAYLFGKAGEISTKEQNEYTVVASDIVNALPKAINSLD